MKELYAPPAKGPKLKEALQTIAAEYDKICIQPAPAAPAGAAEGQHEGAAAVEPAVLEIEWGVALMSPWLHRQVHTHGLGVKDKPPVKLPAQVTESAWALVHEYCRFHAVQGRSDKERRLFDDRFSRHATSRLCEVTSAAHALEIMPLVDLGSRAIARLIEGKPRLDCKSPEQIREAFGLPDDLTEEEKLEPIPGKGDRIRLLNRINEKRRKALLSRKAVEEAATGASRNAAAGEGSSKPPVAVAASAEDRAKPKDDRPIEELLSFIEEEAKANAASKGKSKKKGKKKAAGGSAPAPASAESASSAAQSAAPVAAPASAGCDVAIAGRPRSPQRHCPVLLPLPVGMPQVSLFDDLGDSDGGSGEDNSDGDDALDLDPLRAYLASLALQRRQAPVTTLTSLAAFKAANQQRLAATQQQHDSDSGSSSGSSTASSGAATPHAVLQVQPANGQQATGGASRGEVSRAAVSRPAATAADDDAAAVAALLTAFIRDCGLHPHLQVLQQPAPHPHGAAAGSLSSVARSVTLPRSGASVEVRWMPPKH